MGRILARAPDTVNIRGVAGCIHDLYFICTMSHTRRIATHLWYDTEAPEAAQLYMSAFTGSRLARRTTLDGTPSGTAEFVGVELPGQELQLTSAGPYFTFTPAVSLVAACATTREADELWAILSKGGKPLMELGAYPFSERFGWTQDRYGLSWQVMHAGGRGITQKITPMVMFTGEQAGKAEEAITFYTTVFSNSRVGPVLRHAEGEGPDRAGTVKHAAFTLEGWEFSAMDSAFPHGFGFNEAVSFMVYCDTQEEIDHFWGKLSADPQAEQCGWLKDRYGLSWQIVPAMMEEMLADTDKQRLARVTKAFLKMKKFDLAGLREAYKGS
jgi:predicted 3-demethylubiquinone-9 3-methyltransferase (glyoxalase superfamily)